MKILVINAGSSSVKYQVFDMDNESVLAKGICEQIGDEVGSFTYKIPDKDYKYVTECKMANHAEAIKIVMDNLVCEKHGVLKSFDEISAVGHRVVHGADRFSGSVIITDEVIDTLVECSELSPLHNPHNLTGIKACAQLMPGVPQIGVFDTGFHQTMPDYAYMYALPYKFYEKYKIRRYGFHGTSHRYVSLRAADILGRKDLKIVTCHLGNGSSIAAIENGKCLDTTMGLTPLEGIMMGTRCGSIDPSIVTFLMKKEGLDADGIDKVMNKQSGILGIFEKSSDNRAVEEASKSGDERAQLVEKMMCHQLTKYIGGFAAAMGGVDAIVFCGGIGENNPGLRANVVKNLEFLGAKIDPELNAKAKVTSVENDVSTPDSKVKVLVIPTNEELMIARDTLELVSK